MKHLFKDKTVKMDKVVKMDKMVKADLEDKAAKVDLVATGLGFPTAMEVLDLEEMEEVAAAVVVVAAAAAVAVDAARSYFEIKVINSSNTNALFILQNRFPFWSWQLYNTSFTNTFGTNIMQANTF